MRPNSMLRAALILSVAILQLQAASGSPLTWTDEPAFVQDTLSSSSLVDEAKQFFQVRHGFFDCMA